MLFCMSFGLRFNGLRFKRFEVQLLWSSIDLMFKCFLLSIHLSFNWFEIQVVTWDSSDVRFRWFQSSNFRFSCFEIQLVGGSFALRFNWLAGHSIQCEIQRIWHSRAEALISFKNMKLRGSKTKFFCETSFKNKALIYLSLFVTVQQKRHANASVNEFLLERWRQGTTPERQHVC